MKLYYLAEEALEDLKYNGKENIELYQSDTNQWIIDKFNINPFFEYKRDFEDFELIVDHNNIGLSDIENVKTFHSNLKEISPSEASDERLWAGLSHSVFWDYMKERWSRRPIQSENDIRNRYFLQDRISFRRSLFTNTLSRLWWMGELVYDENSEDPYHLLYGLKNNFISTSYTFFSSNFTSNSKVTRAVLKSILNHQESSESFDRESFFSIIRYANILAGSYLLEYLEEEEIQDKIDIFIKESIVEKEDSLIISGDSFEDDTNYEERSSIEEPLPKMAEEKEEGFADRLKSFLMG